MNCRVKHFVDFQRYTISDQSSRQPIMVDVTSSPAHVRSWLSLMMQTSYWLEETQRGHDVLVGLSVHWTNPPYLSGVEAPADTLQICTQFRCLVVQLTHVVEVPAELRDLLNNPHVLHIRGGWKWFHNESTAQLDAPLRDALSNHQPPQKHEVDSLGAGGLELDCDEYASPETFANKMYGMITESWRPDIINGDWDVETLSREQVLLARVYSGWRVAQYVRAGLPLP